MLCRGRWIGLYSRERSVVMSRFVVFERVLMALKGILLVFQGDLQKSIDERTLAINS